MKRLQLTLESSAENLAIDEALLETAESSNEYPEVFRIWEPLSPMVVLGRSSPIQQEANLEFCRSNNVDVLRRASGGQAIVTGPGCLMYAALLDYRKRPELRMLEKAHQLVMGKMQKALASLNIDVQMQGTSDLTFKDRKFSGNSLRCKRNWLIYHGTMLCDFDLELIANCLGKPIREPSYREGRTHREFLVQLPTRCTLLADAMMNEWKADSELTDWPSEMTQRLVKERYTNDEWTYKVR